MITGSLPQGEIVARMKGVSRRFGTNLAVDDVSLSVARGEVFGFVGPNGAGKSTTIRMLVGLLAPSEGEVEVLGWSLPSEVENLRPKLGYMTQKFSLYSDLSIRENLEFAAEIFGLDSSTRKRRVAEVLIEYGLEERQKQRPAELSGGWKQRVALATAAVHEPELLFLDEPTAGVDPASRREFWKRLFELASRGTTILVSTHYMDEAVRCHRLCMLSDGALVAVGSPDELTSTLDGRIVELTARPTEGAIEALEQHRQIASVTQLGDRIHALLAPGTPPARVISSRLVEFLQLSGFDSPRAVPAEPNLEDAFVALGLGEDLSL